MNVTQLSFERVVVFGAGGPTGTSLVVALGQLGIPVRVVGRSRDRLSRHYAGQRVEIETADALDPVETAAAIAGCDLAVDCIGLPADRMADHPRTAANIVEAAEAAGARSLQVSSFWSYLPSRKLPLSESHPRTLGVAYVRYRRQAEDIFLGGGGAVVHLPDFYGPRVHTSTLQRPLMDAMEGKAMSWIGKADTPREYVFVPDAMSTVAALACREEAYGQRWIVPGAGPLTGREVQEIVSRELARRVRLRPAGKLTLRLASLFIRPLRQFMPMIPDYTKPISYDGSKLESLLGSCLVTPYDQGISATLRWLRGTAPQNGTA